MLNLNELIGFGAGGASVPRGVQYIGKTGTATGTTVTFNDVAFGPESPDRIVVISPRIVLSTMVSAPDTATIAGVSATNVNGIFYAVVPSGLTGTVALTFGTSGTWECYVHAVYGALSSIHNGSAVASGYIGGTLLSATYTGAPAGDLVVAYLRSTATLSSAYFGGDSGVAEDARDNNVNHYAVVGFTSLKAAGNTITSGVAISGSRVLTAVTWS